MSQGLPRKLRYAFILQMVLAGASVIVGALVAGSIVKDVLTDQQLRSEAGEFWSGRARDADYRSEEHTSELQSLMRISYAVFCLKKKTSAESRTAIYSPTVNALSASDVSAPDPHRGPNTPTTVSPSRQPGQ